MHIGLKNDFWPGLKWKKASFPLRFEINFKNFLSVNRPSFKAYDPIGLNNVFGNEKGPFLASSAPFENDVCVWKALGKFICINTKV